MDGLRIGERRWDGGELPGADVVREMGGMMVELWGEEQRHHAVQMDDGSYRCVRRMWGVEEMVGHLRGEVTLAVYPVRQVPGAPGVSRWLCHDLDGGVDSLEAFERLLQVYGELDLGPAVQGEFSGRRGFHVWVFGQPMPADLWRRLGRYAMDLAGVEGAELFPKQADLPSGSVGNPVKPGLGVHRATGKRCVFADGAEAPISLADSLEVLERLRASRLTEEQVGSVLPPRGPPMAEATGRRAAGEYGQRLKGFVEAQRACVELVEGGVDAGCRHHAALLLLSSYRVRGWSREAATARLLSVDRRNRPPVAAEEGERWVDAQARYVYGKQSFQVTCHWPVIHEAGWCSTDCSLHGWVFEKQESEQT